MILIFRHIIDAIFFSMLTLILLLLVGGAFPLIFSFYLGAAVTWLIPLCVLPAIIIMFSIDRFKFDRLLALALWSLGGGMTALFGSPLLSLGIFVPLCWVVLLQEISRRNTKALEDSRGADVLGH